MNANRRIEWLNERDPLHQWRAGQDVFCLHCDQAFKAEAVGKRLLQLLVVKTLQGFKRHLHI
jgi:hypothetical protein